MKPEENTPENPMEDIKTEVVQEADAPLASFGQLLKKERENQGLSVEDAAKQLFLKSDLIEKIEKADFTEEELTIFIRGYFRSYAKLLGIPEEVVAKSLGSEQLSPAPTQKMTSFSRKTQRKKQERRITIITWAVVLLIAGISIFWWWNTHQQNADGVEQSSVTEAVVLPESELEINPYNNQELPIEENVAVEEQATNGANDSRSSLSIDLEDVPDELAKITAEAPIKYDIPTTAETRESSIQKLAPPQLDVSEVNGEETVEVAQNNLQMAFDKNVWIQIRNAAGRVIETGSKKSGDTVVLTDKMPYHLILGTPDGVGITLGGKRIDLSSYPSGKTVRLTLN